MSIREALANMTRGAGPALVGGFLVEFGQDGVFSIYPNDESEPFFESTSLKDSVSFIEDHDPLTGQVTFKVEPPYPAEEQPKYIQAMGRASRPLKNDAVYSEQIPADFGGARALAESWNSPDIKLPTPLPELTEEQIKYTRDFVSATAPVPYGYINTDGFNTMCQTIHRYNKDAGWWTDIETGEPLKRNVGEMLMLVVSEISEAMEGHRKDLMDDKLPHRKMIEVELADAVIRICDIAGGLGLDVAGAIQEKVIFNTSRPDHKIENRLAENGKKY